MSNYNNIYNWILTTKKCEKTLLEILEKKEKQTEEINFFLKATFSKEEVQIPKYIEIEQQNILSKIKNSKFKWISLNAPTSFGKTKILIDLIKETDGIKIIISPTLSLCNEYFLNFSKLETPISMSYLKESNIYVLTPEKANLLFKNYPEIKFSLCIFDEFYEAFEEGRYYSFKECFEFIKNKSNKIISISPKEVDCSKFDESLECETIKTTSTATSRILNFIFIDKKYITNKSLFEIFDEEDKDGFLISKENIEDQLYTKKDNIIFDYILNNFYKKGRKTMIYTSYRKVFNYIIYFKEKLEKKPENISNGFFTQKILLFLNKQSPDTILNILIPNRIGYHHGKMDKFLRFLIECAYKSGELILLICTSTLSKGINLSPEFLVVDKHLQKKTNLINDIKSIEYTNIIGRCGRMKNKMFIGNIFFMIKTCNAKENIKELINIKKEIQLDIPDNKKIILITDFSSASLSLGKDKQKYLNKEIDNKLPILIKKISEIKYKKGLVENDDIKKIVNIITSFFNIKWKGNSEAHWYKYIKSYINRIGYSSIYKNEIKSSKNIDQNDKILAKIFHSYDNEINFHFHKLFLFLLEKCIENKEISKEEVSWFIDEEDTSCEKNWPNCFLSPFSQKKVSEEELNEIIEELEKLK